MKRPVSALLVTAAITTSCIFAASSPAATTFGTSGDGPISGAPSACLVPSDQTYATCLVIMGYVGPADTAGAGINSPISGVITRWRMTVGSVASGTTITVKPQLYSLAGPITTIWTAERSGAAQPIPRAGNIVDAPERLPVKAGERLGFEITTIGPTGQGPYLTGPSLASARELAFPSAIPNGGSFTTGLMSASMSKFIASADVEPDVDGDGYGDETQDGCPARPDTHGPCVLPAITLSNITVVKRALNFTSSAAGTADVTLSRITTGHKSGKKCKSSKKKGKRCNIYTKLAQWKDDVVAATNSISYSYKVGGKSLKRGSYRASIQVSSADYTPATRTVNFKVK